MLRVLPIVATFAFWLYCLLDVVTSDPDDVRLLPKRIWLVVVALLVPIGGLLWLFLGRPQGDGGRGPAWPRGPAGRTPPSRRSPRRPAPRGPDDDPAFLRDLDRRTSRDDGADAGHEG
ncbi:MAG: PLD nuclease N-terminal domain-containing protein [Actinomycetes bacterium]